jgi:hypothetical protein
VITTQMQYSVSLHYHEEINGTAYSLCLHNEKLRDLYSSPSIIRIIKSRRMRWVGRRGTRTGCLWESQRERGN